jgi:hypothetical protein
MLSQYQPVELSSILFDIEITRKESSWFTLSPEESLKWLARQERFQLNVPGLGKFCVQDGSRVEYNTVEDADSDWVRLYMNSYVLVALLHQRKILNFHAGAFVQSGRGVMVLGQTEAGKSSLALSFGMNGGKFLTDDLTPVVFHNGKPYIQPVLKDVKLRQNTIEQLGIEHGRLRRAEAGTGKHYLEIENQTVSEHSLNMILEISVENCEKPEFSEFDAPGKFSVLRGNICLGEMLLYMPETEKEYFSQLITLVQDLPIISVKRPEKIRISDFHASVKGYIDSGKWQH